MKNHDNNDIETIADHADVPQFPAMLEIDPEVGVSQSTALMLASMIENNPEHFTNIKSVLQLGKAITAMAHELPETGVADNGHVVLFGAADQSNTERNVQ